MALVEDLVARLEEAEAKLGKLERLKRPLLSSALSERRETRETRESEEEKQEIVLENQQKALEGSLSPQERLRALRRLRFRDGRSQEVTEAMIELIENPQIGARTRASIIRNLDGGTFPQLKQPLLDCMLNDPDPNVREESVETLAAYLNDPAVAEAMTQVRDYDTAADVREEARKRLARPICEDILMIEP